MAMAAVKETNDQKKMIIAIALGVLAIIALWWTFFGFGSSSKPQSQRPGRPIAIAGNSPAPVNTPEPPPAEPAVDNSYFTVISLPPAAPNVPESRRNIFAFYEPPPPPVTPSVTVPTPVPPPPLLLAALSPANVYARTDDFKLELTGDKFTPAVRIFIDGREMPTHYVSGQQ